MKKKSENENGNRKTIQISYSLNHYHIQNQFKQV